MASAGTDEDRLFDALDIKLPKTRVAVDIKTRSLELGSRDTVHAVALYSDANDTRLRDDQPR